MMAKLKEEKDEQLKIDAKNTELLVKEEEMFQKYAEIMQTWAIQVPHLITSQASVSVFTGPFSSELA